MTATRQDETPETVVLLSIPKRCPVCDRALEHTGDKLFYCLSCCNFFIELDGTVEHYLVNPPENAQRPRLVTSPTLV